MSGYLEAISHLLQFLLSNKVRVHFDVNDYRVKPHVTVLNEGFRTERHLKSYGFEL